MQRFSSRSLVCFLAISFAASRLAAADAPQLPHFIGPYLQNPIPGGATVSFLVQGTGTVEISCSTTGENERPCTVHAGEIPGTPWTIWKSRVANLPPGSTCAYRVRLKEGGHMVAECTNAFTPPAAQDGSTRLLVFNDLHNRADTLGALLRHVKPDEYDLSILLGDCWGDPSPANGAEVVFRTLDAYVRLLDAARKPMLLVRGNHETRGGFAGRMALLFDLPGLDASAKPDDQYWPFSLRLGPAFLVAADTGEDDGFDTDEKSYKRPKFWQSYRQRQTPWLKDQFAAARESDAPWRIFLSHIPLYNTAVWDSEPARLYWEPLLRDADLQVMLAGHDHQWKQVPGGQLIVRTKKKADGTVVTDTFTPPCPVLIGGGPSPAEGTVMVLRATGDQLNIRLVGTDGKTLTDFRARRE